MSHASIVFSILAIPFIAGCSLLTPVPEQEPPQTYYHAPVVDAASGEPVTLSQLAERLADKDVVVIGEYHGHQGAHLLQSRLQAHLYEQRPNQVLTMEQFDVDQQPVLNHYLNGDIGEKELVEDANGWPNYQSAYRPLVEFARHRNLPVIAANAPADIVRCVGRKGTDYLDSLTREQKAFIPDTPFASEDAYRNKFFRVMGGGHGAIDDTRMLNTYNAQLLRDNTMASRILEARERYPGHQVIHLTGTFHSEERLGTVAALLNRQPDLSLAVISPVFSEQPPEAGERPIADNRSKGDYLYFLLPLPAEYLDEQRGRDAIMAQFRNAPRTTCE